MCTPPSSALSKRRRSVPDVDDPYGTSGYEKAKRLCTIDENTAIGDQLIFPTPSSFDNGGSCAMFNSTNSEEEYSSHSLLHDFGEVMMFQTMDDNENSKADLDLPSVTADEAETYEDANLEALLDNFYDPTDRAASQTPDFIPCQKVQTFSSEFGNQEFQQLFESQIPPSSVIEANGPLEARSDEVFDPDLNYSSPKTSSNNSNDLSDQSLLSNDVDWRPVHEKVVTGITRYSTQCSNMPISAQRTSLAVPSPSSETGADYQRTYQIDEPLLRPFKTFFGLQEMLDAKSSIFMNTPNAIFELFARVTYSSRENFIHKQHLQFRELIKHGQLYLNGSFSG